MNLRGIWTVFRKEFRENLRDKMGDVKIELPDEPGTEHDRVTKPPPRTGKMLQR